jgi:Tol biopolymer transport system component
MVTPVKEDTMKSLTITLATLLFLAAPGSGQAAAQSGHDLLQQALVMERAEGDLDKAVVLYSRILEEHGKDRSLCATALLQMASFYERLGRPEAVDGFRRVMEEYPDQADQARQAQARLEAMSVADAPERRVSGRLDPTYTLLLKEHSRGSQGRNNYDLSPDGRRLVMILQDQEPPGVYVSDPVSALPRLVVEAGDPVPLRIPRWSPDGTRIAVLHSTRPPDGGRRSQFILIVDPEGNEVSRIPLDYGGFVLSMAWTPDQQALTYAKSGGIYSVTLDGRETALAGDWDVVTPAWIGRYSPDGDWLAFSEHLMTTEAPGLDVWVMPATGGPARRLTQDPGIDAMPNWGSDGFLYFVSDRSGNRNIWRMEFDSQRGERIGEPEQVTFFKDTQVGPPSLAAEGGKMVFSMWRAEGMIRVADASNPSAATTVARGDRAVDLSPDGSRVFYGVNPGGYSIGGARNDGLFSVSSSGGAPIRLSPESQYGIGYWGLSPDGSTVEYAANTADGRTLFQVPATGGEPRRIRSIIPPPAETYRSSPVGSFVVFVRENGLYRWSPEEAETTLVAELPGWVLQDEGIRFSPDGRYVAVLASSPSPSRVGGFRPSEIFVVPSDGGDLLRITKDAEPAEKYPSSWHPDGQRLTYSCMTEDGIRTTRMAYLDGRPTTLFHDEPGVRDLTGAWAPDGMTYFFAGSDEGENTYRRNPDGTVDLICRYCMLPILSADGRTYLYRAWEYSSELWMMEDFR